MPNDHRAQQKHTQDSQYRRLVESITDYAIYMLDAEGVVASWNPGAERLKGYAAEEIIGQHFSSFYTEEDRQAGLPARALAAAATEGRWETEGWRLRKDGGRFWAHVIVDPIRDDDGSLIGFAKITRDVTERRDTRLALEQTRDALFQSQKMEAVGQLTGGIAHDFNNLLTVIIGGLDTIARSRTDNEPRLSRALDMARHAAERAVSLTSRLLAFSRRQPLQPRPTDLNLLVRDMSELLHHSLGEPIELESVLFPRLWTVDVDRNQLEAAILNLAVNARDAMPTGGRLTIKTANVTAQESAQLAHKGMPAADYVRIDISDSGTGIPAEIREKIFEPFFTTKEVGKGTGLGLSTVYGIVKQTGGFVYVDSEQGKGTTFHIFLPRHQAEQEAQAEPHPEVSAGNGAGKEQGAEAKPRTDLTGQGTILLVEDEEGLRSLNARGLRSRGYSVIEASNGIEAMEALEEKNGDVDLVVSDVVMPEMDGPTLLKTMRERNPNVKIIFVSGYAEDAFEKSLPENQQFAFLPKPFTLSQLVAAVKETMAPQ